MGRWVRNGKTARSYWRWTESRGGMPRRFARAFAAMLQPTERDLDPVAGAVAAWLDQSGEPLRALATRAGVDASHLRKWLLGDKRMTTAQASKVLAAAGLSVGWAPAGPILDLGRPPLDVYSRFLNLGRVLGIARGW